MSLTNQLSAAIGDRWRKLHGSDAEKVLAIIAMLDQVSLNKLPWDSVRSLLKLAAASQIGHDRFAVLERLVANRRTSERQPHIALAERAKQLCVPDSDEHAVTPWTLLGNREYRLIFPAYGLGGVLITRDNPNMAADVGDICAQFYHHQVDYKTGIPTESDTFTGKIGYKGSVRETSAVEIAWINVAIDQLTAALAN